MEWPPAWNGSGVVIKEKPIEDLDRRKSKEKLKLESGEKTSKPYLNTENTANLSKPNITDKESKYLELKQKREANNASVQLMFRSDPFSSVILKTLDKPARDQKLAELALKREANNANVNYMLTVDPLKPTNNQTTSKAPLGPVNQHHNQDKDKNKQANKLKKTESLRNQIAPAVSLTNKPDKTKSGPNLEIFSKKKVPTKDLIEEPILEEKVNFLKKKSRSGIYLALGIVALLITIIIITVVIVFVVIKPTALSTEWSASFLIENLAEVNVAKRRRRQLLRGLSLQTYDTSAIDNLAISFFASQGIPGATIDWKE